MEFFELEHENDKRVAAIIENVKKACKAVHLVNAVMVKSRQAREAMMSNDKIVMWNVLQHYLSNYKDFINSLTSFTGITVYTVSLDFVERCTLEDLQKQLEILINFIYVKEALQGKSKDGFMEHLKKLLRNTGLFSETELALL